MPTTLIDTLLKAPAKIDYGSVVRDDPDKLKVILQSNSNEKSYAQQEAWKSGSHNIFSSATTDTTQSEEEKFEDMKEQLETSGLKKYD